MASRKRKPTERLPPSPQPWKCVILAVDPAETSGWSIWANGNLVSSGEVSLDLADVAVVVGSAMALAADIHVPVVMFMERPIPQKPGRKYGSSGKGRESFRGVWNHLGGVKCRVAQVWPSYWRARFFAGGAGSESRDNIRDREMTVARSLVASANPDLYIPGPGKDQALTPFDTSGTLGGDEAAAICIGAWCTHAGDTAALLPKRLRTTI